MNTLNNPLRNSLITAAIAFASASNAAGPSNSLILDGYVRAEAGGLTEERMILFRNGVPTDTLSKGLYHFQMPVELGANYTLRFEAAGCVTKEVEVNTMVPMNAKLRNRLQYDFQVTLFEQEPSAPKQFNAPVAKVGFDPAQRRFEEDADHQAQLVSTRPARKECAPFVDPALEMADWYRGVEAEYAERMKAEREELAGK